MRRYVQTEHFRRPCTTVLLTHIRTVSGKDFRLFSANDRIAANAKSAAIPAFPHLQVSSFGYEIYDVHMPHSIPLLKEGVKREKILRIMVFDGCERPVLPFLGISVGD